MVPGAYALQHVDITLDEVFTNTVPTDAYRGAGRPEAAHLVERLVDRLADELGKDPAELRRLNFATEFPYTTATGLLYDSGDYADRARQGARAVRLRRLRGAPQRGRRARQLPRHRALDLGRDLRPRAVRGDQGDRDRRRGLGVGHRAPAPDRLGDRRHRLLRARPGPRDVVVADRRERARHPVRPGRRRPWRHRAVAVRPRHLRLALAGRGRHGPAADVREGARQGAPDRGAPARVRGRRPRVVGHAVAGQGLARARQDHPGAGLCRLGRRLHAHGRGAEPRGHDVLRPAELHVPVRLAHRRGRDRRRDRQDRGRALHGGRRLRQRDQSDDRGRAGARRHRAIHRAGPLRGDGLRRERSDPHGHARRVHDPVGGRVAALRDGAHRHAVPLEPARGQGHRRGGHDRGQRRASSTPPSTRSRGSASGTSRCRCSRGACGRPSSRRRRATDDPRGIHLRTRRLDRRGARADGPRRAAAGRRSFARAGAEAAAVGSRGARRHRRASPSSRASASTAERS